MFSQGFLLVCEPQLLVRLVRVVPEAGEGREKGVRNYLQGQV